MMDPGLIVSSTRRRRAPDARNSAAHAPSLPPTPPTAHDNGVAPLICEIDGKRVENYEAYASSRRKYSLIRASKTTALGNLIDALSGGRAASTRFDRPCSGTNLSLTFVELTSTCMFKRTRVVSISFLIAATCKAVKPDP